MSGVRRERAGSLPAPSHHPRGSCPPLLASGPRAQGCLFIHFPRRPSCLTVRAHNGALYSGAPTPIPKGQRAHGEGRQPPALSINSQERGREGRGVRPEFQQNQLETRTGRASQVVLPGPASLDPAADHPQPPEAHSPPGERLSHATRQTCPDWATGGWGKAPCTKRPEESGAGGLGSAL